MIVIGVIIGITGIILAIVLTRPSKVTVDPTPSTQQQQQQLPTAQVVSSWGGGSAASASPISASPIISASPNPGGTGVTRSLGAVEEPPDAEPDPDPTQFEVTYDGPQDRLVLRPRELTGYYAAVKRFVMKIESVRVAHIVLTSTDSGPFTYDSLKPVIDLKQSMIEGAPGGSSIHMWYTEFVIAIREKDYTVRISINEESARFGDVRAFLGGKWVFFDTVTREFTEKRTADSLNLADGGDEEDVYYLPLQILNQLKPDFAYVSQLLFLTPTVVKFTTVPPDEVDVEWVLEHLSKSTLVSGLDALVSCV